MATVSNRLDVCREIKEAFGIVPEWINQVPDSTLVGFWGMFRDFYMAETKIPNKYKELIGLAVSGATRCRYCALFHTEAARLHGATDEQIAEASMMGGMTMLTSTFLNAQQIDYKQFQEETLKIVSLVKAKQVEAGKQIPRERMAHA